MSAVLLRFNGKNRRIGYEVIGGVYSLGHTYTEIFDVEHRPFYQRDASFDDGLLAYCVHQFAECRFQIEVLEEELAATLTNSKEEEAGE